MESKNKILLFKVLIFVNFIFAFHNAFWTLICAYVQNPQAIMFGGAALLHFWVVNLFSKKLEEENSGK